MGRHDDWLLWLDSVVALKERKVELNVSGNVEFKLSNGKPQS